MNLYELYEDAVDAYGPCPAVSDQFTTVTFRQLNRLVSDKAHYLLELGLGQNHRVILPDSPQIETIASLLACWRLGATTLLAPVDSLGAAPSSLIGLLRPHLHLSSNGSTRFFSHRPSTSSPIPDVLITTSGTSGAPKIVGHSFAGLASAQRSTLSLQNDFLSESGDAPKSVGKDSFADARHGLTFLSTARISTMAGMTVLLRALTTGEHVVLAASSSPAYLLHAIEAHQVTNLGLSPFNARQLLREIKGRTDRSVFTSSMVKSLLTIGVGGGSVSPDLILSLDRWFHCLCSIGYGCTEMGGPVLMTRPNDSLEVRANSVGRPLAGFTCSLRSHQMTSSHSKDPAGELQVSGLSHMMGYWNAHEMAIEPSTSRWYRTGDIALLRPDGNFGIIGRASALIIRGGSNIDPAEIEAAINMHPQVAVSAVIGRPSRIEGEEDILAFVVADTPTSPSALLRWCVDRLPNSKVPRRFIFVSQLPTLADGEYDRLLLRASAAEEEVR